MKTDNLLTQLLYRPCPYYRVAGGTSALYGPLYELVVRLNLNRKLP